MFANGVNYDASGDEEEHNRFAYVLLYMFITLGLFLILSQYFIAILVGAFDTAKVRIEEEAANASTIPKAKDWETWFRRVGYTAFQLLTGYSLRYQQWSAIMIKGLKNTIKDIEEPGCKGLHKNVLKSHVEVLKDHIKEKPTEKLLQFFVHVRSAGASLSFLSQASS